MPTTPASSPCCGCKSDYDVPKEALVEKKSIAFTTVVCNYISDNPRLETILNTAVIATIIDMEFRSMWEALLTQNNACWKNSHRFDSILYLAPSAIAEGDDNCTGVLTANAQGYIDILRNEL